MLFYHTIALRPSSLGLLMALSFAGACGSDQGFTGSVGTFDSLDSILGQDPLLAIVGRYVDGDGEQVDYALHIADLNGDLVPDGTQYPEYPALLTYGSSYPESADNLYVFQNRYVVLTGVGRCNARVLKTFDLNAWNWLEPLMLNLSEDERVLGLSPHADALYMVTAQPVADLGWIDSDNYYINFKRYDYDMRVYDVNLLDQDIQELSVVRMRGVDTETIANADVSWGSLYALFQSRDPYIGLIHKGSEIGENNDTYFFNVNHPEDEWQFQSVIDIGAYHGQFDYYHPDDGYYVAMYNDAQIYYLCGRLTITGRFGSMTDIDPLVDTGSTCMIYEYSVVNEHLISDVSLYASDSNMTIGHLTAQDGSTVEMPNYGEAALIWKSREGDQ